jgi:ATP synthase protein I
MNNTHEKISKLKEKIEIVENKKLNELKPKKETGAGFAFKISTELIAALIVGVGIGLIVDNYLGSKPFGLIIFFILGSFAGFLNIYRVMRRIEKQ